MWLVCNFLCCYVQTVSNIQNFLHTELAIHHSMSLSLSLSLTHTHTQSAIFNTPS